MLEQSIRAWNPWWVEKMSSELIGIPRDVIQELINSLNTPHIKDIIGVRRCGKTTLLYQLADYLISSGITPKNIIFLNFDDPSINVSSFEEIQKEIFKINPEITHLFLDEIQQKKEWERWVRMLYDTKKFVRIFISGSSASLLSEDISRVLTGRHITFMAAPFSFKEYLSKRGWTDFRSESIMFKKDKILHYLTAFLEGGGFPEAIGVDDFARKQILTNLYNDILARDISSRYGASYDIVNKIARFMLTNLGSPYSINSVAKATNIAVETSEKYIGYLKEALLIYDILLFSFKLGIHFKQNKKAYPVDTGIRNTVCFRFSPDSGKLAEAAVFLELKRRNPEVYYWKNSGGYEVDFVIKEQQKIALLIQVAWNIMDEATRKREENSLIRAMDEFNLSKGLILTEDNEEIIEKEGKTIEYIPLWKWLLL
jgi:predicted AAA+ superfamily ATPase